MKNLIIEIFFFIILLLFSSIAFAEIPNLFPQIISPVNGANINSNSNLSFSWAEVAGATKYEIALSASESFNDNYSSLGYSLLGPFSETSKTYTAEEIKNAPKVKWYWMVRAGNSEGWGPWSNIYSFILGSETNNLLTAPTPLIPTYNSVIDPNSGLSFSWAEVAGATKYEIALSASESFNDNYSSLGYSLLGPFSGTSKTYTAEEIKDAPKVKWYWIVRAKDANNNPGPWSGIQSFKLGFSPISAEETQTIKDMITLGKYLSNLYENFTKENQWTLLAAYLNKRPSGWPDSGETWTITGIDSSGAWSIDVRKEENSNNYLAELKYNLTEGGTMATDINYNEKTGLATGTGYIDSYKNYYYVNFSLNINYAQGSNPTGTIYGTYGKENYDFQFEIKSDKTSDGWVKHNSEQIAIFHLNSDGTGYYVDNEGQHSI